MDSGFLSKRMSRVQESATLKMAVATRALIARGEKVINLSIGEPHFPVPESVQKTAIQAILDGKSRYTPVPGNLELRKKIADKFLNENGVQYKPEQISVATGAKQSLFNAFLAVLNEGDEVIIPAPYWTSYPEMVRLAGGVPRILPSSPSNQFKITPETLAPLLTPKTKVLLINNPCNPTGTVYDKLELISIWECLKKTQTLVFSDEIYEHLVLEKKTFTSFASISDDAFSRTLTVNGFSKSFAMTGWRLGYAAGPLPLIQAMNTIQGQSTSGPNSIAQEGALAALDLGPEYFRAIQKELSRLCDVLMGALSHCSELSYQRPEGAFYLFVNISSFKGRTTPKKRLISSSDELALYLLEEGHVAVVPGSGFGNDDYVRLSFAANEATVKEGARLMIAALNQLKS